MKKRRITITVDETDDVWSVYVKVQGAMKKQIPRKRFGKWTKRAVLFNQGNRCKICYWPLENVEFDHIDGDRTNNSFYNCQALCPNCHAKKTKKKNWFDY